MGGHIDDRYSVQWEREIAAALAIHDQHLARRARNDALGAIARDIPDPAEYARYIPLVFAEALTAATQTMTGYHVSREQAELMRPYGLVEYGGRCLTAFGIKVRQALKAEDA